MHMRDGLAGIFSRIHNDTKSGGNNVFFLGDFLNRLMDCAQKIPIRQLELRKRRNVPFRDYEHVHRRPWIDVAKRQGLVRFFNNRSGDLFLNDSTEQAVGHP